MSLMRNGWLFIVVGTLISLYLFLVPVPKKEPTTKEVAAIQPPKQEKVANDKKKEKQKSQTPAPSQRVENEMARINQGIRSTPPSEMRFPPDSKEK
jgi:hypothetical protein